MRRFGGTGPGRILVLKRLALHSGRSPTGRVVWALAFRAIARATATLLTRGERDASLYWRGSANDDFIPGLSDIDLAIVLAGDGGAPGASQRRVRRRRGRRSILGRDGERGRGTDAGPPRPLRNDRRLAAAGRVESGGPGTDARPPSGPHRRVARARLLVAVGVPSMR